MREPKDLLGPMRLPFLILPPACVFLGAATTLWTQGTIDPFRLLMAFAGAVAAHISVNALNEYFDLQSGLDLVTRRTPFSGGSGTLPAKPEMARTALYTGLIAAAVASAIGLYFVYVWGLALLPLGILGLVLVFTYTNWITHYPFLSLIAPGLGFGTLMVMGTDFVLSGTYSWPAFWASLVPFFLVSNLLLLNQFPDVEADRSVGRRHYPIVVGRQTSSLIYTGFSAGVYLFMGIAVLLSYLPAASLLGLLSLVLAIPTARAAIRYAEDLEKLIPFLGLNVILTVSTPILVGVGLLLAPAA